MRRASATLAVLALASAAAVAAADGGDRLSLERLLGRLRHQRDERLAVMRDEVDAVLRAMEIEAQTRHEAGLEEQKARLAALGPEATPLLVEHIDPGPEPTEEAILLARTIAGALASTPTPLITDRLIGIARSGSSRGRLNAARILAVSPDRVRAGEMLAELFRTTQGELRRAALAGVARLGGPENRAILEAALQAPDPEAVRVAIEALAEAHATDLAPRILAIASAPHEAAPFVPALLDYYRACPEALDGEHLRALVGIAGEISIGNDLRAQVLDLLARSADAFDGSVKKELRALADTPTREIRESALVILALAGDRTAKRDLLADYDEQIDRNKQWPASYEARGNILYRVGDYRDAIRDYQKCLSLSANDFRARTEGAYVGLARCYAAQGKLREASQALEKAPIPRSRLAELSAEPVFARLLEHPRYGKVFRLD